jgi:hypothetical protein
MKINTQNDTLTIENSVTAAVTIGTLAGVGGAAAVIYGLTSHKNAVLLGGIAAIIVSILTFIFSKGSKITLNKSGPSTISAKHIFGTASAETFQLSDVMAVELDTRPISQGNSTSPTANTQESTVSLQTKTGQRIRIGRGTHSVSMGGAIGNLVQDVPLKKEAESIAVFIGVPGRTRTRNEPATCVTASLT